MWSVDKTFGSSGERAAAFSTLISSFSVRSEIGGDERNMLPIAIQGIVSPECAAEQCEDFVPGDARLHRAMDPGIGGEMA